MTDDTAGPSELSEILEEHDGGTEFDWEVELEEEAVDALDVLRFTLGGNLFAIAGSWVREIVGRSPLTPIPGAPEHIEGITLLRREVLGVLDLSTWLGLPQKDSPSGLTPRLIVIEFGTLAAAFVADSVDGIESWPEAIDASTVPSNVENRLRSFALSSRWAPGGIVTLLDVQKILSEAAVR